MQRNIAADETLVSEPPTDSCQLSQATSLKGHYLSLFQINKPGFSELKCQSKLNLSSQGRGGGGLVVSVLAFYSDDRSSNPAGYLNFLHEKMKISKKEARVGPSLKENHSQ